MSSNTKRSRKPVAGGHVQVRAVSSPKLEVLELEVERFVVGIVEQVEVLDVRRRLHLFAHNNNNNI